MLAVSVFQRPLSPLTYLAGCGFEQERSLWNNMSTRLLPLRRIPDSSDTHSRRETCRDCRTVVGIRQVTHASCSGDSAIGIVGMYQSQGPGNRSQSAGQGRAHHIYMSVLRVWRLVFLHVVARHHAGQTAELYLHTAGRIRTHGAAGPASLSLKGVLLGDSSTACSKLHVAETHLGCWHRGRTYVARPGQPVGGAVENLLRMPCSVGGCSQLTP